MHKTYGASGVLAVSDSVIASRNVVRSDCNWNQSLGPTSSASRLTDSAFLTRTVLSALLLGLIVHDDVLPWFQDDSA
jgi:hypothetical protein